MKADELVHLHHLVTLTRAVDLRLWTLSRQGRAGFVLTARGHEVAQVASATAVRVGTDSAWLYYRDLGVAITLGVTPYEIFLGALARASDPHSGVGSSPPTSPTGPAASARSRARSPGTCPTPPAPATPPGCSARTRWRSAGSATGRRRRAAPTRR